MFPQIKIINREISSYSIMALIGLLVCLFYLIRRCKKDKVDDTNIVEVLIIGLVGLFIGSHILYAITKYKTIIIFFKKFAIIKKKKLIFKMLGEIFGGSVFYGGLIGGILTTFIAAKKKKLDLKVLEKYTVPLIPLFHGFGRIGCFLSGCCYGIESKIGFTYTHSLNELANGVTRFPIQLVESGFNFIIFFILNYLSKKNKNNLLYIYLIVYPVGRFILEFFRGDSYRGFLFGLSTSQIISLFLIAFAASKLIKNKLISR